MNLNDAFRRAVSKVLSDEITRMFPNPIQHTIYGSRYLDKTIPQEEVFKIIGSHTQIMIDPQEDEEREDEYTFIIRMDSYSALYMINGDDDYLRIDAIVDGKNKDWKEDWKRMGSALDKLAEDYKHVPKPDPPNNIVPIRFVFRDPQTSNSNNYQRGLVCPAWEEVKKNYPLPDKVKELMDMKDPLSFGKLIFWHGVPGTGKTYAIRALMRTWRDRGVDFRYIMDPADFFSKPLYMTRSIMDVNQRAYDEDDECEDGKETPFTLFILEDSLDFLLKENRRNKGAMMSTLLNLTEGIIGQGLRIGIMVTSNEELKDIDDAFVRPGRCIQELEFKTFQKDQAIKWASDHDFELEAANDKDQFSLADLYAARAKAANKEIGTQCQPIALEAQVVGES